MSARAPAIGIDLGTANCCVAVFEKEEVHIIENDIGGRITPSSVAFTQAGRLVGDAAKWQIGINPECSVFDVKRLIGRRFVNQVSRLVENCPFKVLKSPSDQIKIHVTWKGEERLLCPEEVCAIILKNLKNSAESYLGQKVTDAVITVPSSFNDSQRQATIDAATIAELNVLRLINEPSSVAIAYAILKKSAEDRNILVFNMGAGFLDVSVINISNGSCFEVMASASDAFLGGQDFDYNLVHHLTTEFRTIHKKVPSKRTHSKLKAACETAKKALSCSAEASIQVETNEGFDLNIKITRDIFEAINSHLFQRILNPVEKAMWESKIPKSKIDDIILVGGSTRIPKIQNILKEYFNGKELCLSVNPDEGVAHGAAVYAAFLKKHDKLSNENLIFLERTPWAVGFEATGGVMSKVIERKVYVPCEVVRTFPKPADNLICMSLNIFDGDNPMTRDNNYLGNVYITGRIVQSTGQVEIIFGLDCNNCLHITAQVANGGKRQAIEVSKNWDRLSPEEIKRYAIAMRKYELEEHGERLRQDARNRLESFVFHVKHEVEESVLKVCDETLKWADDNDNAAVEDYVEKMNELKRACASFIAATSDKIQYQEGIKHSKPENL